MQSSDLVSAYTDQALVKASTPVQANNKEIMKQSTILLRLINLLDKDEPQDSVDELIERVTKRLETSLGIWELYLKRDKEELSTSSKELEKALESREVLRVRKEVGDISDEEYELKIAVAEWGIENYQTKTRELEKGVAAMSNLRDQLEPKYIEEINRMAQNGYQKIRDMKLRPELTEMIIRNLNQLA